MSGIEWKDGLSLLMAVTNVGVIFTAGRFFQQFKSLKEDHGDCKKHRETNEVKIFERLDRNESDIAYQKGKLNGAKA